MSVSPDQSFAISPQKIELLQRLLKKRGGQRSFIPQVPREEGASKFPLSFEQQRLWFLDQLEPGNSSYNIVEAIRLLGHLNIQAIESSFENIIERHEILRTTFVSTGDQPGQQIHPSTPFHLPILDLQAWPEQEREREVHRLLLVRTRHPFDLSQGPLLRVEMLQLGEQEHILVISMHHIVSDGWSMDILHHEMNVLYTAYVTGKPALLSPLPIQYADYAVWQCQWLQGELLEKQLSYWKKQLAGISGVLDLPSDRPRPPVQSFRGAKQGFLLPETVTQGLKQLSRTEGTTLFMTLLATFQAMLCRYTGQEDIVVGTPIANRPRAELDGLIGFFVNTLVIRTDLAENPTFREIVQRVRGVALDAYAHQDVPFERIVEALQPERDLSRTPLFQAIFILENENAASQATLPNLTVLPVENEEITAKFDITFSVREVGQCLEGNIVYCRDLFDESTILRFVQCYQVLIDGLVSTPDRRLWEYPLLSEKEQQQQLVEWNQTSDPYPAGVCLHQLVEAQVQRTPEDVAVIFGDEQLTYRALNERANQLARTLQQLGVGPEVLVGVCLERSVELVVALLGILKAGSAYVPLDPAYPQERLAFILQDSQATVVISKRSLQQALVAGATSVLWLEELTEQEATKDEVALVPPVVSPENAAYVIYTSGSTGKPKGVVVTHQNVLRLFGATQNWYHFSERDIWTLFHSFAFDFSVWELWGALLFGGRLVIVPYLVSRSPEAFYDLLSEQKVTVLNQTPSAFYQLMQTEEKLAEPKPLSLRTVIFGGEALDIQRLAPWFARHGDKQPQLVNMYGITETTVHVSYYPLTKANLQQGTKSLIGSPIPDLQIYVLGRYLQLLPIGVPGEIYVGGAGVARGYLTRPELTSERFVPHPYSTEAGARLYKTGDRGRYLLDGTLEYLGRLDSQVKIRGFRIELGEIEEVLSQHPKVEAVVVQMYGNDAEKSLVAYVVARGGGEMSEWRNYLRQRLPEYMVPSAFVCLSALPLTVNGKVDRRRLPVPKKGGSVGKYVAPRTELEEQLSQIWAQLLGLERVGVEDNFFDLGGHSLKVTQVMSRIQQMLNVKVPLRSLFENPTIAELACTTEQGRKEDISQATLQPISQEKHLQYLKMYLRDLPEEEIQTLLATTIAEGNRNGRFNVFPVSYAQQRMWILEQIVSDPTAYIVPVALRLFGPLHRHALEQAIAEIVSRHEALRTVFPVVAGRPLQVVKPASSVPMLLHDLQHVPQEQREATIQRLLIQEIQRPFSLQSGPLFRSSLAQVAAQEHILLLSVHHIIFDGWSYGIFIRELVQLYESFATNQLSPLPTLPLQYADYTHWQRQYLQSSLIQEHLAFWREHLAEPLPILDLPTDHPRPPMQTFAGAEYSFTLPPATAQALKRMSQQEGATLFMSLLASWAILLSCYSGQTDLLIGAPIANRTHTEVEGLIGCFINTLVLRTDLSGNPTLREVLRRVKRVALETYAHQDVPFEQVVEAVQPQRDLSRSPLFQVMFSLQSSTEAEVELPGLRIEPIIVESKTTKFDLTLLMEENPTGLSGTLEYNSDLFESATIRDLLDSYLFLLDQMAANPEQRLGAFSLLTPAQQQIVLEEWNATQTEYPADIPVHHLFEAQVARTPEALAVSFAGETLTYAALNRRANQLAHALRHQGVGFETRVGLYLQRSIDMVVAVLAILKAGGAYLPLDLSWPDERSAFVLADAGLCIVLTSSNHQQRFARLEQQGLPICLDKAQTWLEQYPQRNPENVPHPDQLAYLIYTSGSTGVPKSVMVTHRGLANYLHWGLQRYQAAPGQGSLVHSSLSFDLTVTSLFLPLLAGGMVTLLPEEYQLEALGEAVQTASVGSLVKITPAHLAIVNTQVAEKNLSRKSGVVVIGGEQLYREHLQAWQTQAPETLFLNEYGPTETVVGCCVHQVSAAQEEAGPVPIGRPIANMRLYVLDRWLQPAIRGAVGELYIAGVGLARGYLHRPALTAERFLPNPFSDQPGERLYRTGDLVRYQPDGTLEYLGRNDTQVKLRGYRIELGEIESVLRRHPRIEDCAVLLQEAQGGNKQLVAYVVLKKEKEEELDGSIQELHSILQKHLPSYMVPSAFLPLNALPLTPNGKVNMQALCAHKLQPDELSMAKNAPRDEVELQLAQIWKELMPGAAAHITDDFFESGGHSLLAMRFMARIQETFGQHLPLSVLFQGATIKHLASLLRQKRQEGAISSLVPIQRTQSERPFFCIHPVGGDVLCYLELARALGQEQAVSGLQAVGLYGERNPYQSIEAMACHYIQALRVQQPNGPYALGGWSMGGVIAFEMARRLRKEGQEIACLVLLDSYAPTSFHNERESPQGEMLQFIDDIANLLGIQNELPSFQFEHLSPDEQLERFLELVHQSHLLPEDTGFASLQHRLHVFQANKQALYDYRPQVYPGHLHLIRASEQVTEAEHDMTLGWGVFVQGGIDCQILPGNHYTLMEKPAVQALAAHLRTYLR